MQMFKTARRVVGRFGTHMLPVCALVFLGLVAPSASWAQQSQEAAEEPEVALLTAVTGPLSRDITTAYPNAQEAGNPISRPYMALLPAGFTWPIRSPGSPVRSYRTLSP